jgi:uncharacterized protein YggE
MNAKSNLKLMPMLIAALLLVPAVGANAADEGISVTGTATVKGKPTEVEITGTITGEGEIANDASVKFRDNKKKATDAIVNMKNADLAIDTEGSDIHEVVDPAQQQRMMQGMGAGETPKVRVQISEKVKLRLKNVDKVETQKLFEQVLKLIDTSRDAGITIGGGAPMNYYQMQMEMQNGGGGSSLVQFKIPDTTDLQNEAYKQAIADARAKAQRIADLSGVKLGKVLSVHDEGVSPPQPQQQVYYNGMMQTVNKEDPKEARSTTLADIPITVNLQVQFAIEK